MMIITLEQSPATEQPPFQAMLRFPHGSAYALTITPPFSAKEEDELAWYFEQHLRHPYMDQVRAEQVVNAIQRYGESLFKQVFADPNAYGDYRDALRKDGFELQIMGQPAFHALHWESLKDPQHSPLALSQSLVRKPLGLNRPFQPIQPQESPVLNVLLVVARPGERQDVGYRTISRPLVEMVRDTPLPVNIEILRPATFQALSQHLETVNQEQGKGFYHLIHFDVHGAVLDYASLEAGQKSGQLVFYDTPYGRSEIKPYKGKEAFLFLVGETEHKEAAIEADTIRALLQRHGIPMVVLNACQSAKQDHTATETSLASRLMQAGTQWVVAMAYSVTVSATESFMRQWYQQLFTQRSLAQATIRARWELKQEKSRKAYRGMKIDLEDWLLPVVYQSAPVTLPLRDFRPEEEQRFFEQAANRFQAVTPRYGFFGRDLDILAIENRLLRPDGHNILLVRGLGGAGKTTLLTHLGEWWQTTRLVKEVFYFGYDEKAWTAQQMMATMARQLWGKQAYQQGFQAFSEEAQVQKLAQALRATRHLLIIDNLESVTGELFAIQHALNASEQAKLKTLLQALAGGKTLVLLGSRGEEAWLAEGTFAQRRYELGGLDAEAASNLAAKILCDCGASHDQKDPQHQADLRKLLKLLQGFPLALQVVLENLRTRTPAQILEALFKGEAQIDFNSPDKTKSLLKCIEYSHSNLSAEAQQLLLFLAPFVGVIHEEGLPGYTEQLTQHPELAHLPFTRWKEVLQEASRWGLITAHEVPGYLRLQPIFPYFLQNRLQAETPEFRAAIDRAFRGYYEQVGYALYQSMQSKKPSERQQGQSLTKLEFENLSVALQSALQEQVSIQDIYLALGEFLEQTQAHEQGIAFSKQVLAGLEKYPPEADIAYDKIIVAKNLAEFCLSTEQYSQVAMLCQQNLAAIDLLQGFEATQIGHLKAGTYYQLGRVAQGQRQWEAARDYYQQALDLYIEFNARYEQAGTYHQLGMVAQAQRQWEAARDYYQQALDLKIEFNARYEQARTYHQLGRVAQAQRQWEAARDYYQQALDLKIEFNARYEQAGTYHQLGRVAQEQRQWEVARDYYQQALDIYIEFNARYKQARTYHQLGRVAQEQRQWEVARDYYQQALDLYIEFNARYEQAGTYHNLGRVAQEQRQWEAARDYYQQALDIYIEFNARYEQASTYHNLGIVAREQRQWEATRDYYQQALDIYIEFNARYEQAITYHNLGRVAQEQRQWEAARDYYQQALDLKIECNARYEQARTYHGLGIVAQEQWQWEVARDYYQQALDLKIEFNARYEQASTYHQLGRVAQEQRQWEIARDYYQQALDLYIEFNARYEQAGTYHQLGRVAQEQRQWEAARDYYQQALDLKIECNARYEQASTYLQLGMVAQEQWQWEAARDYYQQALDLYIEFNDRYKPAYIYEKLGFLAIVQQQWLQAAEYLFTAFEIFKEDKEDQDGHNSTIILNNLNILHIQHPDLAIPEKLAARLGISVEEVLERFKQLGQSETT